MELKLSRYRPYFDLDKRLYFLLLCAANMVAIKMNNTLILTDDIYYQTYGEQVAIAKIESFLDLRERISWLAYVFVPIILLIKISFVALCLNIGTLFSNIKLGFKRLFRIALVAELIFVVAGIIRILWLYYVKEIEVLQDVQYFYPLSMINFFSIDTLESWFIYPMVTLNLFEVAYFMALGLGLHWALQKPYGKMLRMVIGSYGIGLLIWALLLVFLTINIS